MAGERQEKRSFALAVSLVLVAAMFSFYLSPTTTGQHYVYLERGALEGSPPLLESSYSTAEEITPQKIDESCTQCPQIVIQEIRNTGYYERCILKIGSQCPRVSTICSMHTCKYDCSFSETTLEHLCQAKKTYN